MVNWGKLNSSYLLILCKYEIATPPSPKAYKKIKPYSGARYCNIAFSMNVMSEWDGWCWFRDRDNGGALIGYFPLRQSLFGFFRHFWYSLWGRLWICTNIKCKICTEKWLTKLPEINDARKRKVGGLVMTSLCLFLQDWYVLVPMRDYLFVFSRSVVPTNLLLKRG